MGDFEEQTAVESLGDGRYRATLHEEWRTWGPDGGYVAAVALRAAGAASRFDRPASIACQYLRVAEFGGVELRVTVLRAGKRSEALRVSLLQGDHAILEAGVWTVGAGQGLVHDHTTPPPVPPPDGLRNMRELTGRAREDLGLWSCFERRPVAWVPWEERVASEPELREWFRFRPRETSSDPFADAARPLILIDTFSWPAIYGAHPVDGGEWIAPNLDLHVRFHRSAEQHAWLLCDSRADPAEDGLIGTEGRIWTAGGKLLASGSSQLFCRPRPQQFR